MKILIFLIFLGTASAINDTKLTLGEWYREVQAKHPKVANGQPFYSQINEIYNKKWCINDKIDIFNYQNKVLNWAEASILIYGAGMDCLSLKDYTWKRFIKLLSDHYRDTMPENKDCFLIELQKIDLRSAALENFNSANIDATNCDEVVDNAGFYEYIESIEQTFRNIDELTCNAVNAQTFKRLLLTILALSSGKVGQYSDFVTNEVAKEASKILDNAFKCVKARMISRGNQWVVQTTNQATTTTRTQNRQNFDNDRGSQGGQDDTFYYTGRRVLYYGRQYDVYTRYGYKFIFVGDRWLQIDVY